MASEERVASGQWSVASESEESGQPMQEEGRSLQNVQNEANPESTQSSLPLDVESSEADPAGRKRSQFTQAVANGERRVAREQKSVVSEREAGETAVIEGRQKRHHFLFGY